KVLQARLGERPEFVRLFAKEAKVGALIGDNTHIVNVYDAGLDEERQIPFIVMDLLEGETLEEALERGPVPRALARRMLEELGDALEQAHEAGVVHRDLKPGNLFLVDGDDEDDESCLKVMDFGIAKVLEAGGALRTATQIGTPAYTAPEQMGSTTRKLAAKQGITIIAGVSPATDVWAIGLLAYEMLTGDQPGQYWGIETLTELPMKVAFEDHEAASERAGENAELLPEGFDEWFARCLRKDATERWASAGEAVSELLELLDADPGPATPKRRTSKRPSKKGALTAHSLPTLPKLPDVSAPAITMAAKASDGDDDEEDDRPARKKKRTGTKKTHTDDPVVRRAGKKQAQAASGRMPYLIGGAVVVLAVAGWFAYDSQRKTAAEQRCLKPEGGDAAALQAACSQACDTGSMASCSKLGALHERGQGVEASDVQARDLYQRACGVPPLPKPGGEPRAATEAVRGWISSVEAAGCPAKSCHPQACASLASFYEAGRGELTKNVSVATALYERVCGLQKDDSVRRGTAGCIGLGIQREAAGQAAAALPYYQLACDDGLLPGCLRLAGLLERGDDSGVEQNDKHARSLYQKACDEGDLEGCTRLGKLVERGRGGWKPDVPAAVGLYKRACDGGALLGCTVLASAHLVGKGGVAKDAVRAVELLRRACDGGEQAGCAKLATLTAKGLGGLKQDEKRAFELNEQACKGGALLGCANLGMMYLEGQAGLTKNETEGRELLDRACRGGEPVGCLGIGRLDLAAEKGPAPSIEGLFRKACDNGAPEGCVALGEMAEAGALGQAEDLEEAVSQYRRACTEGAMRGCTNLANLVYQGAGGVERDAKQAAGLNEQACRGGDKVGCARLGLLYAMGHGVKKDKARAAQLYQDACTPAEPASEGMKKRCAMLKEMTAAPKEDG
ncbi:MAG: SEL1-like repeat protein, partial [Deltaproteobacteria bacterium]|nr:SEL1-like repeat protein [Deltaproteobacteria bacterium]